MALISIIPDFRPLNDARLLDKAEALTPALRRETHEPVASFSLQSRYSSERVAPAKELSRGDNLVFDFGRHLVGRVTLSLSHAGSHPDAPAFIKLKFAETPGELWEDASAYDGWLSRSWIQEETLHVDTLPAEVTLPRRYAFRYVKLTVLDTSPKYRLVATGARCVSETSADPAKIAPSDTGDARLDAIRDVSLRTLSECMQEIFEDGPKRDQRLWMGDLRLQALSNYASFGNNDLVKRCLYLFGGTRFPDGRVSANLFTRPEPAADDTFLFDYALMFPVALNEYVAETGDLEALDDLYDIAMAQVDYALAKLDEDDILNAQAAKECFIDWCDPLDRTACAQGVLIWALGPAFLLCAKKGDERREVALRARREDLRRAALERFWSEDEGCFISNGQISPATQVWMTLAGVGWPGQRRQAMERAMTLKGETAMATPYMHHYFIMALLEAGMKEEAETCLKDYWGGMLDAGADTFWECWDPAHPDRSPYGGAVVNSYCHAWSCTPAYIIDRFLRPR